MKLFLKIVECGWWSTGHWRNLRNHMQCNTITPIQTVCKIQSSWALFLCRAKWRKSGLNSERLIRGFQPRKKAIRYLWHKNNNNKIYIFYKHRFFFLPSFIYFLYKKMVVATVFILIRTYSQIKFSLFWQFFFDYVISSILCWFK